MACIDGAAGPCILNSTWVDKMKFGRVKWVELPVKLFDEVKCSTRACNIIVKLAAHEVTVHAAIIQRKRVIRI